MMIDYCVYLTQIKLNNTIEKPYITNKLGFLILQLDSNYLTT